MICDLARDTGESANRAATMRKARWEDAEMSTSRRKAQHKGLDLDARSSCERQRRLFRETTYSMDMEEPEDEEEYEDDVASWSAPLIEGEETRRRRSF